MGRYVWRIATDTPNYGADDLSGKGAELTGGRWNREGIPLLYASTSIALACLETMVHLEGSGPLPLNRYLVRISISSTAWRKRVVFDSTAHVGWDAEPPGLVSMDWGTQWAASGAALLAEVPSVVVPEEPNILINPIYNGARDLEVSKLRKWRYDFRLFD
jgi:RES domain-containing protein